MTPAPDDPGAIKCTCPPFDGEQAISIACPVHGYPGYPTTPNPAAIDLESCKMFREVLRPERMDDLIAARPQALERARAKDEAMTGNPVAMEIDADGRRRREAAQKRRMTDISTRLRGDHGECCCYLGLEAADWIDRLNEAITTVLADPDLPSLAAQILTEAMGSLKEAE